MVNNIGLEQELFFIPREAYERRMDLQFTGRTVLGKMPARGQEGCDHYMAPINVHGPAMACMKEIQEQCYKLGIPLKTRHREVAPNQYQSVPKSNCPHGCIMTRAPSPRRLFDGVAA